MDRPSSIRDIARATGLGKSTVAKALAGLPGVAAGTRAEVQRAAETAGYRRDPVLADLAARRWRSRPSAVPRTLAYVYDYTRSPLQIEHNPYLPSAQKVADRHGYRLEAFDLAAYPSHARASQVLWTRGYRGLLVGRIMRQDAPIEIIWSRFSAVACALGLIRPPVHLVEEDYFEAARCACETALKRGYVRPGYVHCVNNSAEPDDPERIGGHLFACRHLPPIDQVPVCVCGFRDSATFRKWLHKWHPDVVIGFNDTVFSWIREAGRQVPRDIGYVTLSHARGDSRDTTGFACMDAEVGAAAVELLVGQIHLNARGIPDPLQTVFIEPHWVEGSTLPDRQSADIRAPLDTTVAVPTMHRALSYATSR